MTWLRSFSADSAASSMRGSSAISRQMLRDVFVLSSNWASLWRRMPRMDGQRWSVRVGYDDAPYGVAWWVLRYERADG